MGTRGLCSWGCGQRPPSLGSAGLEAPATLSGGGELGHHTAPRSHRGGGTSGFSSQGSHMTPGKERQLGLRGVQAWDRTRAQCVRCARHRAPRLCEATSRSSQARGPMTLAPGVRISMGSLSDHTCQVPGPLAPQLGRTLAPPSPPPAALLSRRPRLCPRSFSTTNPGDS